MITVETRCFPSPLGQSWPQMITERQTEWSINGPKRHKIKYRHTKKQTENSRLISLTATCFFLGFFFHYMPDEGVHLTLHVFLVWLFPPCPSSSSPHIIPGARSGPVHLHLKWPSTFQPPLQSAPSPSPNALCLCVCVYQSESQVHYCVWN